MPNAECQRDLRARIGIDAFSMIVIGAGIVIFAAMIAEAAIAARNDRRLRAMGAVEPRGDVIRVMQIAYPASFLVILAESAWRGAQPPGTAMALGAAVFAASKALKYWAIATLGPRWTFRVLVPPGSSRIRGGPYRYMSHPNYVGVAGEIAGAAIALRAPVAGPIALAVFGALMLRRIGIEERALSAGTGERA